MTDDKLTELEEVMERHKKPITASLVRGPYYGWRVRVVYDNQTVNYSKLSTRDYALDVLARYHRRYLESA